MKRLFSKIATLSVGLAMAIGVGIAAGTRQDLKRSAAAGVISNTPATAITAGKYIITNGSNYINGNDGNGHLTRTAIGADITAVDLDNAFTIAAGSSASNWTIYQESVSKYVGWSSGTAFGFGDNANTNKYRWTFELKNGSTNEWIISNLDTSARKWGEGGSDIRSYSNPSSGHYFKLYLINEKELNHIGAAATNPSNWFAGDTFKTSDVTVTPYYSEDNSDPDTPITDGEGVKFGDSADKDSVTLVQGSNSIKVNYGGKSTTINVTAGATPVITGVVVGGDMANKTYSLNDDWDYSGLYLTVSWTEGKADTTVQFTSLTITANPAKANSTSIKSVALSGTYEGHNFAKTVTGITVTIEPVVIEVTGGKNPGARWKPGTGSAASYTDSLGNTATLSVATGCYFGGADSYSQIGSGGSPTTYVNITITLAAKAGIVSASATFASANGATASVSAYGDDENDAIFSGSVEGNGTPEVRTINGSYQTINATTLHFNFTCQTGIKLSALSYTLGDTVAEFGNFTSLEIGHEANTTQFKVGDKFSYEGLVLTASDDSEPVLTKDYVTGFKIGTALNDNSYANHTFVASDAENSPITVHATLTIKEVTKEVTYQITVTEVPTYTKVTDPSSLYEGARVIIVGGGFAFASHNGTVGLPTSSLTITDDKITDPKNASEFVVRIYGNKIALQLGSKYLAYQKMEDVARKQVYLIDDLNDASSWTYTDSYLLSNVAGRYLCYTAASDPTGFACVDSGSNVALYISDKSVNTDTSAAETYAYRYLHMRDYLVGDGSCKTYYASAKAAFEVLTDGQKAEFIKLTSAVERLQAWADANGEAFDPVNKTFTKLFVEKYIKGSSANYAIIIIVATVSITALGVALMVLKKKKHN